jgi:hypothetical protein
MGGCSPLGILAFLCQLENLLPLGGWGYWRMLGGGLIGWKKLKMRKKTVKYTVAKTTGFSEMQKTKRYL